MGIRDTIATLDDDAWIARSEAIAARTAAMLDGLTDDEKFDVLLDACDEMNADGLDDLLAQLGDGRATHD